MKFYTFLLVVVVLLLGGFWGCNFMYLFLAALRLRCCAHGLSLVVASGSHSLVAVCRLLTVVASRCRARAHGLQ